MRRVVQRVHIVRLLTFGAPLIGTRLAECALGTAASVDAPSRSVCTRLLDTTARYVSPQGLDLARLERTMSSRRNASTGTSKAQVDTAALSDALLAQSQLASSLHLFDVAYHALAAALYAAAARSDIARMSSLADEARRQQRVVDAISPHHRVASRPPSPGGFDTLAVRGHGIIATSKGADLVREAREATGSREARLRAMQAMLAQAASARDESPYRDDTRATYGAAPATTVADARVDASRPSSRRGSPRRRSRPASQ